MKRTEKEESHTEEKRDERSHTHHDSRRLYRSRKDKIVAGVAGGIAQYFDIDPVIVRVIFFILIFTSAGFMFFVYLVLALLLPEESGEENANRSENLKDFVDTVSHKADAFVNEFHERRERMHRSYHHTRLFVGMFLVGVGLLALFNEFFPMHWFRWSVVWPSVLIFLGALIVFRK